jgi:CubicO group peptidase (beta-lactamase class C family)
MKPICSFFALVAVLAWPGPLLSAVPASSARVLQPFVDRHELAGAVALVVDRDKVRSVETVGFADIAGKKKMKPDAMFWIASQTKAMTATALMMLVDEGKVALDDAVEKHLPEFRGQMLLAEKDDAHTVLRKPGHPITIREVLSHMSGMPFQSALETPTYDTVPLAALVRSYAITPLQTEPGTRYHYSSAGINIAGRIIEVVSGMKYEDFMDQRLFRPLGMSNSTFWPDEKQARRVAKSYRPDGTKTNLAEFQITQLAYPLSDRLHRFPIPAGGLFSTAQDTARFCQMLLNGGQLNGRRYVSEAALKELTKRQTPPTVKDNYGLCFALGTNWFGHGGAQATTMEIHPDQGVALIWMVQHAGFPGEGGKAQGAFKSWALEQFGH